MALSPNSVYEINGVTVNEKIIPDGTVWQNASKAVKAGFKKGSLYKSQSRLSGTGKASYVTIHNTNDLVNVQDDAEQYTRATYNENMGSARVHFYVDEKGAWQNLKAGTGQTANDPKGQAEVSWHAGDGSAADGGNMTSLSIEIIMGDSISSNNERAKDNGARIAAWLLYDNGLSIDKLVTHTYWVNKSAGKKFDDVDVQCTNLIANKKWCPTYIFGSTNHNKALENWRAFKHLVNTYLSNLEGDTNNSASIVSPAVSEGGLVAIADDAVYYSGKAIPDWVKSLKWYVKEISGSRAVIDKSEDGKYAICSPIDVKYLRMDISADARASKAVFEPYLVKVKTDELNVRSGAGTNYKCVGKITDFGTYTIIDECDGPGASKWGKLKSGMGWISLDFVNKKTR